MFRTTVIIEDINFKTDDLANAVADLQFLFKKHQYFENIIWGHALSGNIHFVLSIDFNQINEIERYNKFMNDKDFQGKFDYILYNNYDSESEKQILDLVKNLIVNE